MQDNKSTMSAIEIPRIKVISILKVLSSGRTKPCLVQAMDNEGGIHEVVIKWRVAMELKATGLVCELISALLADDLDLPVPRPFLLEVENTLADTIRPPEVAQRARDSVGLNFGAEKLPPGFSTYAKDKPVPVLLRPLAAEIFAFDVLIQNPDRRQSNPNLLAKGDELSIYDHEQAFSFLAGVIGWQPPWTGEGLGFYRDHVFFHLLTGLPHNWDRMRGALGALTDARLDEYVGAVPTEWRANNDAAEKITSYLRQARVNRESLFRVIGQLLQ